MTATQPSGTANNAETAANVATTSTAVAATEIASAVIQDSQQSSQIVLADNVSNAFESSGGGSSVTVPAPETGDNLVWIPTNGGEKYHSYSGCSNMIDPIQVTLETALANDFTLCKRCH